MQNLGAGPSEQWYYDVIVHSQSWYELFNEDVSANQLYEYKKDGSWLELICINSFFYLKERVQNRRQKIFDRGSFRLCRGDWHIKIWQNTLLAYGVSYFNFISSVQFSLCCLLLFGQLGSCSGWTTRTYNSSRPKKSSWRLSTQSRILSWKAPTIPE